MNGKNVAHHFYSSLYCMRLYSDRICSGPSFASTQKVSWYEPRKNGLYRGCFCLLFYAFLSAAFVSDF